MKCCIIFAYRWAYKGQSNHKVWQPIFWLVSAEWSKHLPSFTIWSTPNCVVQLSTLNTKKSQQSANQQSEWTLKNIINKIIILNYLDGMHLFQKIIWPKKLFRRIRRDGISEKSGWEPSKMVELNLVDQIIRCRHYCVTTAPQCGSKI